MLKGKHALFPHSWKFDETGNGNILPNLLNLLTNIYEKVFIF